MFLITATKNNNAYKIDVAVVFLRSLCKLIRLRILDWHDKLLLYTSGRFMVII